MAGDREGTQPGSCPGLSTGISQARVCHAQQKRTGGRGRKGLGHSWGTGQASACWGMCCITSWVCFFFPSVLFLNFVQLTSFLASALSVLLSIPADSEQGAVWEVSCWLGWTSSAGLWCSAKHSTYQGNCFFHGEKLQIPHSTTWSLIGNRFTLEKRHNSSVCNWGEKLCSGGCSSYPECPEEGRWAQKSPSSYTHRSERFKSSAPARTTHNTLPQGPESMS